MISERSVRRRLAEVEAEMVGQVEQGMQRGWPVLFWDRNCVERAVLRKVLGLPEQPYCAADTMAGW